MYINIFIIIININSLTQFFNSFSPWFSMETWSSTSSTLGAVLSKQSAVLSDSRKFFSNIWFGATAYFVRRIKNVAISDNSYKFQLHCIHTINISMISKAFLG